MADYLPGIDYGTGGAKATIINDHGEVLAYAFEEYPIPDPAAGLVRTRPSSERTREDFRALAELRNLPLPEG